MHWQQAKLDKISYAEIDSEEYFDLEEAETYRGTLNPIDFNNVLMAYLRLKTWYLLKADLSPSTVKFYCIGGQAPEFRSNIKGNTLKSCLVLC